MSSGLQTPGTTLFFNLKLRISSSIDPPQTIFLKNDVLEGDLGLLPSMQSSPL